MKTFKTINYQKAREIINGGQFLPTIFGLRNINTGGVYAFDGMRLYIKKINAAGQNIFITVAAKIDNL